MSNYLAKKGLRGILLSMLLLPLAFMAQAEQKEQLGQWDVHYIVVNSTFFSPEIARQYGIVRSKYNALVNISVLESATQQAQTVGMQGTATNLLGTEKKLAFKKVQEGDAIYYLAVFDFRHDETYRFNIEIRRGNTVETLKFQQKMYVD
ncbi:DUF4426 domain-containing protein [Alteromonas lipolytica]|uniref:DUF4426 domain-containing protein n=1 Tax=Alteromonas lipolytica TaxID=1856405 RepID=A0A1E8F9U1_9ALTE|nr:DUF4426 domain-containing protein [Alteromonas lipolytica]OFI32682.1 hypothetical protein BFC17_05885 [Alteromonas lipolytica]GGF74130.1 hypothetical protein GCM10011338_27690 [Alteromonas lipolytica]